MQGDARDDERDAGELGSAGYLAQDRDADHGRRGGQQGHHQRVGRAGEADQRQLIGDVRDDRRCDADPQAGGQRDGIDGGGRDLPAAERCDDHQGDEHRPGEAVDAVEAGMLGDAVGQHDVGREQRGVGERERHAQRRSRQAHVGEQVHAGHSQSQRARVPGGSGAERRERDHRQELDRGHRSQGQPADRLVEAGVHHGEDDAHPQDQAPGVRPGRPVGAPGAPPEREDRRR